MKKICANCEVEFIAVSNKKYCGVCAPLVKRDQTRVRVQKHRDNSYQFKEPVSLQEKIAAVQNWPEPHNGDLDVYSEGFSEDYYTDSFVDALDLSKEIEDEK